jgi:predicted Fe-Mo cluster-binding NifX family protein
MMETIRPHFGRAHYFRVLTMENGKIVYRDLREKFHPIHAGELHHGNGPAYGHSPIEQDRHSHMINAIPDCQIVIAGGMGRGAYNSLVFAGLQPFLTDEIEIEEAIKKYLQGTLVEKPEQIH